MNNGFARVLFDVTSPNPFSGSQVITSAIKPYMTYNPSGGGGGGGEGWAGV